MWARPYLRLLLPGAALVGAYVGTAKLGAAVAEVGTVTAVWAPSGIALAALAIVGLRLWPAVALAALLTELLLGLPLHTAAVIAVGNTLEAVLGLFLMRRVAGFRGLDRAVDVIALALLGGLVACTVAATTGTLALRQAGIVPAEELGMTWLVWWVGDAAGVLVVAPAVLALAGMRLERRIDRRRLVEVVLLTLLVAALVPLVVLTPTAYPFLVTIPLVWAALSFGASGAALTSLGLGGVVVVASALDTGPFVDGRPAQRLLLTAAFVAATGVMSLLTGAVRTERLRAEEGLRRKEAEMRALVELAPIGIFATEPDGLCRLVNPHWLQMTGMTAPEATGTGWSSAIHPDDREQVFAAWSRAAARGAEFRHEFRFRRPDGRVTWVESRAVPVRADDGATIGWVGANADIGERLLHARELAARERIARAVADDDEPQAIFRLVAEEAARVIDTDGGGIVRFVEGSGIIVGSWAGAGLEPISVGGTVPLDGSTATAVVARTGRSASAVYGPGEATVRGLFRGEASAITGLAAPVRIGGSLWGAVGVTVTARALPDGAMERLERFADLVALAVASNDARAQLTSLASTDALTGLLNRRAFQDRVAGEIELARRLGRALSLVLIDVDHFKSVNDAHGHPVGDRVLIEVARRLFGTVRDGEVVARVGGEEFVWLLPGTAAAAAARAAERLRAAIADEPFADAGWLTVSLGVADLEDGESFDELFRLADRALYRAKAGGRDRVVRWSAGDRDVGTAGIGGRPRRDDD